MNTATPSLGHLFAITMPDDDGRISATDIYDEVTYGAQRLKELFAAMSALPSLGSQVTTQQLSSLASFGRDEAQRICELVEAWFGQETDLPESMAEAGQ